MRLVHGHTLHEMLQAGALEPGRATDIVRQIAAALDAAPANGLIHRDIKPHNIIVTPDDFAYLVDFGIAQAKGETHLTMVGYQVGSWHYMAPERFGDQQVTPAADIYSLTCVLYEALTGRTPFPGNTEQVIAGHLSLPPPRPSALNACVPAGFDDVIARGMAKDPDDRYGSAGALGRAAKRALSAEPPPPSATNTWLAPPPSMAPGGPPAFNAQFSYPPTGPGPQYQGERSRNYLIPHCRRSPTPPLGRPRIRRSLPRRHDCPARRAPSVPLRRKIPTSSCVKSSPAIARSPAPTSLTAGYRNSVPSGPASSTTASYGITP
ncbi:Serine/threonine-protein kinase PknH [Mycobacterium attenuatum]|uniref:non-specific serine/threonine protein kinase n=1 Tax=Mycobacterium attenuatum TaxID=2341086 RepID=A0A498Q4Q7_9MYCO|nr:Serine/threonine-protein kinase PknH [Mycobacterium attenuatum]